MVKPIKFRIEAPRVTYACERAATGVRVLRQHVLVLGRQQSRPP